MLVSTQLIVLSKRPFRESSLLLSGLSPDCGRLDLVANGAQKLSAKSFPAVDLFRELEVEFDDAGGSDLRTARRMEIAAEFDAVAENPRHFRMAGRIGSFLLKNAVPNVPLPYTYDALRSVLRRLSAPAGEEGWSLVQCSVVLKTAYLYENGLLPEGSDPRQNDFLENLVAAGIENAALPACRPDYWKTVNEWLSSLLDFHHLAR